MNKSHKSIWNAALGTWVAVSEVVSSRGKRTSSVVAAATLLLAAGASVSAQTVMPTGNYTSTNALTASPWNAGSQLTIGNTGIGDIQVLGAGQVSVSGT